MQKRRFLQDINAKWLIISMLLIMTSLSIYSFTPDNGCQAKAPLVELHIERTHCTMLVDAIASASNGEIGQGGHYHRLLCEHEYNCSTFRMAVAKI